MSEFKGDLRGGDFRNEIWIYEMGRKKNLEKNKKNPFRHTVFSFPCEFRAKKRSGSRPEPVCGGEQSGRTWDGASIAEASRKKISIPFHQKTVLAGARGTGNNFRAQREKIFFPLSPNSTKDLFN